MGKHLQNHGRYYTKSSDGEFSDLIGLSSRTVLPGNTSNSYSLHLSSFTWNCSYFL